MTIERRYRNGIRGLIQLTRRRRGSWSLEFSYYGPTFASGTHTWNRRPFWKVARLALRLALALDYKPLAYVRTKRRNPSRRPRP